MNSQQIQFNRQWVASLLLAGLILALAAGLACAEADASSSTFQPAKMVPGGAYSPQSNYTQPSTADGVCPRADFWGRESGLLSRSQLRVVKGSKLGTGTDGVSFIGCESGLSSESHLRSVTGGKGGISGDC